MRGVCQQKNVFFFDFGFSGSDPRGQDSWPRPGRARAGTGDGVRGGKCSALVPGGPRHASIGQGMSLASDKALWPLLPQDRPSGRPGPGGAAPEPAGDAALACLVRRVWARRLPPAAPRSRCLLARPPGSSSRAPGASWRLRRRVEAALWPRALPRREPPNPRVDVAVASSGFQGNDPTPTGVLAYASEASSSCGCCLW